MENGVFQKCSARDQHLFDALSHGKEMKQFGTFYEPVPGSEFYSARLTERAAIVEQDARQSDDESIDDSSSDAVAPDAAIPVEPGGGSSQTGPCVHGISVGCGDKGFLPMSTADYFSLLHWTARQTRADKRGSTPQQFAPWFDRLGISAEIWCRLVKDFERLFRVVAGQPQRVDEHR